MSTAMSHSTPARRDGAARRRLLETAIRLFYAEGTRAVGIDRIIAEADIAKATFYNHFQGKDDLVVAYLEAVDEAGRAEVEALTADSPRGRLAAILGRIAAAAAARGYRGCPFLNAAAEYPDPASAVRQAIAARRSWYLGLLRAVLDEAGDPDPESTATLLAAVSDGLLEAAYLDPQTDVAGQIRTVLDRLAPRR
jgi:AcrR family transcriptional regulator